MSKPTVKLIKIAEIKILNFFCPTLVSFETESTTDINILYFSILYPAVWTYVTFHSIKIVINLTFYNFINIYFQLLKPYISVMQLLIHWEY